MKRYFGPVRIDPKHVDELVKQVWLVSVTLATASTVVLFSHLDPIATRRIANVELPAIRELKKDVEKLQLDPFPSALVVHYLRKEHPSPECVIVPFQLWKLEHYCPQEGEFEIICRETRRNWLAGRRGVGGKRGAK